MSSLTNLSWLSHKKLCKLIFYIFDLFFFVLLLMTLLLLSI